MFLCEIHVERVPLAEVLKIFEEAIADDKHSRTVSHDFSPEKTVLQSLQRHSSASSSSSSKLSLEKINE